MKATGRFRPILNRPPYATTVRLWFGNPFSAFKSAYFNRLPSTPVTINLHLVDSIQRALIMATLKFSHVTT